MKGLHLKFLKIIKDYYSAFIGVVILAVGFYYLSWGFIGAIIALGALVFFHELGHFVAAKLCGVGVITFSVGMGKGVIKKVVNKTTYQIAAFPLGGYVQLKGQDDTNPLAHSYDSDSLTVQHPLKKIFIFFAGALFNFILAWIIYLVVALYTPVGLFTTTIDHVADGYPAKSAGLMVGDKIVKINSKKVFYQDEISEEIQKSSGKVSITFIRDGLSKEIELLPKDKLIGISTTFERQAPFEYANKMFVQSFNMVVDGLVELFIGKVKLQDLSGVVGISDVTTKIFEVSYAKYALMVAIISINLGVINLLPLPVLDGGHILFSIYELVFKRRLSDGFLKYTHLAFGVLLLSLMLFTIYNDIRFTDKRKEAISELIKR